MLTHWHGIRITGAGITVLSTSDDTGLVEPVPWGTDLTSVAAHGTAAHKSTAASGIGSREESVETVYDAVSVVEGLSGTESPAGSAVGLVSNFAKLSALGPVLPGVEVIWEWVLEHKLASRSWDLNQPVIVDDRTEGLPDIGGLGLEESVVFTSVPGSFHRVNSSDVLVMIDDEVLEVFNAHLDLSADLFIRDVR